MPSSDQENRAARDAGHATAETAVVLPVLVLFAGVLIWGLMAAAAQIQCVDAARAGARAAARSEPRSTALAAARSAAPRGAEVGLRREEGLVRVTVTARAPGPGGLGLTLRSEAVASDEASADPGRRTDPSASGAQESESGPSASKPENREPKSGLPGAASSGPEERPLGPGPSASRDSSRRQDPAAGGAGPGARDVGESMVGEWQAPGRHVRDPEPAAGPAPRTGSQSWKVRS